MVIEDIAGGLKNALEKGESLEKAKASFINAGYDNAEVDRAANYVLTSVQVRKELSEIIQPKEKLGEEKIKALPSIPKPKKKKNIITVALIITGVVIFLLILMLIITMLGVKIW